MDAVDSKQPCQCELCNPNLFLGLADDYEREPFPGETDALEQAHRRKLQNAQVETLMLAC